MARNATGNNAEDWPLSADCSFRDHASAVSLPVVLGACGISVSR